MTSTRSTTVVLLFACIVPVACEDARPRQEPPERSVAKPLELHLKRVLVDRVRLTTPRRITGESGEERLVTEAYLVRLEIDHPAPMGERIRFFAGEREIEEYGGWEKGIYFKVHDEESVRKLDGGELAYSFLDEGRRSLGERLEFPPMESLEIRPEAEVVRSPE